MNFATLVYCIYCIGVTTSSMNGNSIRLNSTFANEFNTKEGKISDRTVPYKCSTFCDSKSIHARSLCKMVTMTTIHNNK